MCPVCGRKFNYITVRPYRENLIWAIHGGGEWVCTRCAKKRREEIEEHNRLYHRDSDIKKDPNCEHDWAHPYLARWVCTKCYAEYNWMCGCGGSMYVCEGHYVKKTQRMIDTSGSVREFLKQNSW